MVDNGFITEDEGEEAKAEPLVVNPRVVSPDTLAAGYFVEEVRREITNFYGPEKLYDGGLSVRSDSRSADAGHGSKGAGRRAGTL